MTLLYSRLPVPILEINIMFLLKTAKVEVRIIDKHSKLAHWRAVSDSRARCGFRVMPP